MLNPAFRLLLLLISFATMTPGTNPEVRFVEVTKQAGFRFERPATPGKEYVVESIGAGVAFFDFDNDGFLDIYFVNGQSVETAIGRNTS